jgi:hypothetical protein
MALRSRHEADFAGRHAAGTLHERYARAQRSLAARLHYFDMRPRFAIDRRRLDTAHASAAQSMRWQLARRRGAVEQLSAKLARF